MFAQESVMDIKKLRQEFEKHASKFFKTNEAFEDDGENYVYDEVKFMWDCWLAAKAQAVPEGFVLVEKTKLMQIVGSAAIIEPITRGNPLMSKYKTELDFILSTVRAMIEAQEPAND